MLVAISIPIFTSQLEKSREAVDAANLRAAYAEITSEALSGNIPANTKVNATQTQANWAMNNNSQNMNIGGLSVDAKTNGNNWTIASINSDGHYLVTIN